nr:septum formation protein Maf [Chloroflexota bacterium]
MALLGLPFVVHPAEVEEVNHEGEDAATMVARLAQAKAHAARAGVQQGLIVAADTAVYLDGEVLGKPKSPADAVSMLRHLRARPHKVFSAVTVLDASSERMRTELAQSTVWMRNYSDEEIATYVASGDPLDKAGSYAIQYADFAPVGRIEGCYANVMGLPLCHLYRILREFGLTLEESPVAACDHFNQRRCNVAGEILSR